MAKKARSSAPNKAAPKKAAAKTVKKVAKKTVKKASTIATKPKAVPARKVTKKAPRKTVTKASPKKTAAKKIVAARVVLSPEVKAAREAEEKQATMFDKAARLFQSRKFGQARPILEKVSKGPNVGLCHRAGVYLRICEEQTATSKPRFRTVEDHYNYAVQLINDRQLEEAEPHLKKALKMDRKAAHAHYALAVLKVLSGDTDAAHDSLKNSIQIDPQNRILALRDPDFSTVSREEPFKSLLAD